ncbi:MAG: glutamate-1-semialdehyde 2,1-aminomutase [Acidobacteriota bacterium]|nr:glutamate-1-semialdehyde 2,1-aminomutase [Acidobacteriota bacterium]MDH3784264.1 glutamate-1-semialdehyde 2,1-aminomutase [Acidobacteriota bacterium]
MSRLFDEAQRYIAGGVNSPVRAFKGVGGTPLFLERGEGCRVQDSDGRWYIDYVGSWGPLIAGHAHPAVVEAIQDQARRGTSFGAPCELETRLAAAVCERVPACERLRCVSTGTEATMSAIRLARGVTGRERIVKVEGCYHGHFDSLLVEAGSGVLTLGIPGSPGVPKALAELTHVVPFNDVPSVEELFSRHGEEIACMIVEPVAGNMGVIPPSEGYLEALRRVTADHGALLILDEVMTGFRVDRGGAQNRFGVQPDLSCFGKVIGGGLPVAAYGGRADLMEQVAPNGPVYQAGTLSGNPLAMRAGLATLALLDEDGAYDRLERTADRLHRGWNEAAERHGVPLRINRVGSMLTGFFTNDAVSNFSHAVAADTARYARFFHGMLQRGVYLAPSAFEAAFISLAHDEGQIDQTIEAMGSAMGDFDTEKDG